MSSLKWLFKYLKKYKWAAALALIFTLLQVLFVFAQPLLLGSFVDHVIKGGKFNLLWRYASFLICTLVLKEASTYIKQLCCERMSQGAILNLRNTLFDKLSKLDAEFFDHSRTGDIMARLTEDTEAVRMFISGSIPSFVLQICYIIVGFTVMFSVSIKLTLSLFVIAPFVAVLSFKWQSVRKSFMLIREASSEINSVTQENISGNRVVKAYGRENYELEKFEKANKKYFDKSMDYCFAWMKIGPPMNFCVSMTNVIFIGYGGYMLMKGALTMGQFTTVEGILWCIVQPMAAFVNIVMQYHRFVASSIKIRKLEDAEPKIKNHKVLIKDTFIDGKIEFKNVSFAYEDKKVLKTINFSVKPGQTIGIIGPTGSGKTTVVNLISRFYDVTEGAVYIDDVNIKNIDITTMRKHIAFAMQDIFLFSDTIEANIAYGVPGASHEDVVRVAKAADAHEFIMNLSDGYDTIIGERGVGLSGGQRQRLSLARALLKNPSILILDDTTSAVDMETEFFIQNTLNDEYSDKTKIIIAHRISSVKNADLILVLNNGYIIEWGNHEQLIKENGYYKSVCFDQLGDFNKAPGYKGNYPRFNVDFGGGI
ncbi:MAG: ABC transporter ATP-binding protein [Clostridia bacterium]|nr:ABC transporter ATP-binding protein [Clostridia bacterium]